ncbi:MAG TPA: MFS transporter [Candidatus Dormibacteraeota bacterium]|nr:MFS transporter [Candidatus Dormibacteraeota bacterium]
MNVAVLTAPAAARFGNLRHTALSAFWFGNFFMWQPLTTVVIQNQIDAVVPKAHQGTAIGLAVSVGGLFAMTVPPIVGAISDRLSTSFGRRRPIMVGATLLTLPGLLVLATANNYTQIVVGYALVQFFFNAAGAAFAGIIPDVVPAQDFGRASGFLATMVQLGSGAGLFANTLIAGAHLDRWIYLAFAVVMVLTLVPTSLAAAGEGTQPPPPRQPMPLGAAVHEFFRPMLGGDFAWVIATRFFVSAGITAVAYYLNNFFRDVVGATDPGTFTSEWFLVVLLVAIPFGLAGGYLSDRMHKRKLFVFASGGFQAFVALVFIVFFPKALPIVFGLGAAYGIGYGLYYAVDWALACDTLPNRSSSAKDMGLFHIALTLPQFVVPFFAGPALDHFNAVSPNLGYRVVFASAIVLLLIGTIFVSRIRSVR